MRIVTVTLVTTLSFIWASSSLFAQFGMQSHLAFATFDTEMEVDKSNPFRHEGIQVATNYWFRLENIRIEFFPEVSYSSFHHKQPTDALSKTFTFSQFGLAAPISIYPFDLGSDCNCPTFSKQNEIFKKGFFVQLTPGYYFSVYKPNSSNPDTKRNANYFGFGAGIGLDMGLSDLITITPIIVYNTFPDSKADTAGVWLKNDLTLGLRVMFRPDYRSPF